MTEEKPAFLSRFYSGLSGLALPIPKYLFPPPHQNSTRLTYYASLFRSIEVNSTFYKLPKAATITKWVSEVPGEFRFTFKLWKEITHVKLLDFKETDVEAFFKVIAHAIHKKGCVLVQFPPSLNISSKDQLERLLSCIDRCNTNREWKIALEFRNTTWYQQEMYDLLKKYGAALVIQDMPKKLTPSIDHTSEFLYIRFHGPSGNYRDSYAEHFLSEYATYVHEWLEEGKTVFVYFNNTAGDAFRNLQMLNKFIYREGV